MTTNLSGNKGSQFEELLRAYFLRAGFFVVRGVPVKFDDVDATDIDLWLYERPLGTARRRQVVDAKFKQRPKAVERLLWTKGLVEVLNIDGGYVATTDRRQVLRPVSRRLGLALIDGSDLDRIQNSNKVSFSDRISEEELHHLLKEVDRARRGRDIYDSYMHIKTSIADHFGPDLLNRSLEFFSDMCQVCVTAHPASKTARAVGRLSYFGASMVAVSLDFLSIQQPFGSVDDRKRIFSEAIRVGSIGAKLEVATALIRRYAENGSAIAAIVEERVRSDMDAIPAEIIADHAIRIVGNAQLFQIARTLEHSAFMHQSPPFDHLDVLARGFVGTLLDFSGIDRASFACAWGTADSEVDSKAGTLSECQSPCERGVRAESVESASDHVRSTEALQSRLFERES